MKKIVSVLLLACMLLGVFSLTACSSTKSMGGVFEVPEGGYDGSEVTITFYHTMGASLREVLDKYIVEFNKLYPNIHIEHKQIGSYDDVREKIATEITVGNQPNIAYCYPDHVALYNRGNAVATLDNLIASTIEVTRADGTTEVLGLTQDQIADFIPGYYAEGACYGDGLMYTLPMSKSTEVLYYNKTFFEENNLTVPTTWEEMEAVCEQIKKLDPNCIPLGYDSEANWFITLCEQYGSDYTSADGDRYLFNNETNRNFVTMFRSWYKKGYVTTQELNGGAYTSDLFTKVTTETDPVRCYMCIGSTAGAAHQIPDMDENGNYLFEVGIATIPQVNPEEPKVISQGPSLCIFGKENAQEVVASWLFVKYLCTTVEFQADFSMVSGYIPVIQSVTEDAAYAEFLGEADGGAYLPALSTQMALSQSDAYFVSPAFNGSSNARSEVGQLMQTCLLLGDADLEANIQKAFENAVNNCKAKDPTMMG